MTASRLCRPGSLAQAIGLVVCLLAGCSNAGEVTGDGSATPDPSGSPRTASSDGSTAGVEPTTVSEPAAASGSASGSEPTAEAEPTAASEPGREFPGETTTGPDPGIELEPSESIEVSEDGAVVENLHITGGIVVTANDVTIRNVLIDARQRYGIQIDPETSGTVIEEVRIVGGLAEGACNIGIVYGHFEARRVDISGCSDGIRAGSNTLLEDSWIHDMRDLPDDHSDGVQAIGGVNIVLRGNNIQMDRGMTSAMILHGHLGGDLRDVVVEGNLLSGGGYSLNIKERTSSVADVVVRDNVWVRDSYNFGPQQGDAMADPVITTWEGNVFDDGEPNMRATSGSN